MTQPSVSIVMATRDRDYVLAHTLTHLARVLSDSEVDSEIIVVDNGSSDNTSEVLAFFENHLPLVSASEPAQGKNRALNRALLIARGDWVLFTDDDVVPGTGWLDNMMRAFSTWTEYEIFGGRIIPRFPPGKAPAFDDAQFGEWAYSAWDPQGHEGPTSALPLGPNFAVRASALTGVVLSEEVGPGAGPMGSETTLLKQLVSAGCRIVYVPDAPVHHLVLPHQLERNYLVGRAFRLGRGIAVWASDSTTPRIAGVPRYLWREIVTSWVRAKLAPSGEARLQSELDHHRARGQVFEYRRATRLHK